VKVEGPGCGVIQEGSGFAVGGGLVVTNAHVVAGVAAPQVIDGSGPHPATAVLFDPELDVAVLAVRGLAAPPLTLDRGPTVSRGSTGAVLGYPNGGAFTYGAAGVMAWFEATGLDIYGRNQITRTVYELAAVIRPGNSGGPLVYESANRADPLNGQVVGVVFARSTTDSQVGYALGSAPVAADVARARVALRTVSTGPCAS